MRTCSSTLTQYTAVCALWKASKISLSCSIPARDSQVKETRCVQEVARIVASHFSFFLGGGGGGKSLGGSEKFCWPRVVGKESCIIYKMDGISFIPVYCLMLHLLLCFLLFVYIHLLNSIKFNFLLLFTSFNFIIKASHNWLKGQTF